MSSTLEERLKNNSSAFDGLLSLIPAKYYYDDDTQNQWKAKKQTKEEAKEAKRAKLDPSQAESNEKGASASDVLKQRAATAKPVVLPGVRAKIPVEESNEESGDSEEEEESDEQDEDEDEESEEEEPATKSAPARVNGTKKADKKEKKQPNNKNDDEDDEEENINIIFDDDGNEVELQKEQQRETLKKQLQANGGSKSPALTEEEKLKKAESLKALKDKLASRISALKEKRKAIGTKAAGAPSSREAILEERRRKAEAKAEAKAAQKKRKLDELENDSDDEDDESGDENSDDDDGMSADNVLYQNIRFNDDERTTSDLSKLRKAPKKKGPAKKDLKAHLKILEAKKQKLSQLEDSKQKEQKDKEKWNTVLAQAEGEKLRNDEKLLKKALKRKEAQKRRSEVQWRERKVNVENSISAKQKRREENLQIRKDNKGIKRKSQAKQKRKFKGVVVPKRAGFEGRRSRK